MPQPSPDSLQRALEAFATRLPLLEPRDALDELARVVRSCVPCDYLSLSWQLPEADGTDTLWLAALWAGDRCSTSGFPLGLRIPVSRGALDYVFSQQRVTVMREAAADPFHERLEACGIQSGMTQAIGAPVIGLMFVGFAESQAPATWMEGPLEQIANTLARAANDGHLLALPGADDEEPDYREDAADVLLTVEPDGHVAWANAAAERLFGRVQEKLVGTTLGELFETLRTGYSFASSGVIQAEALRSDGDHIHVEVVIYVDEGTGRRRLRVRDQPDLRRRLQVELTRRNAELRMVTAVAHAAASKPDFVEAAREVAALIARHPPARSVEALRVEGQSVLVVGRGGVSGETQDSEGTALLALRRVELACGAPLRLGVGASGAEYVAVGLAVDGVTRGGLLVGTEPGGRFRQRDLTLYRTCGDALAGALGSTLRYEVLQKQAREHRALVDSVPAMIFQVGLDGKATFINQGVTTTLGYTQQDVMTDNFTSTVVVDSNVRPFAVALADHVSTGAPIPWIDLRLRHKRGHVVTVRATLRTVYDDQGTLVGMEGVASDVTAEREAQRQLVGADRLAALGLLAAGVGHEINNPAAYISLGVQQIGRLSKTIRAGNHSEALLDRIDATLGDMEEGIKRITAIVGELRLFARSPEAPYSGPTDVNALLRSTAALVDTELKSRARLELSLGESLPMQPAGYQRLAQVFLNLFINAAQAIAEGAPLRNRVHAESRIEGDELVVRVRDSGPGIAPDLLARVFDPFFTTKPPGEGTGLGLAISYDVVKQLGGTLAVESREGDGCLFTVRVPSLPYEVGKAPLPALVVRHRVLVVDDDHALATQISWELERRYCAEVAFSGQEALARLAALEFDALVCDLRMPGMSGIELFRRVREIHPRLAGRFVFLSGMIGGPEEKRFLSQVDAPVCEKPFQVDDLLRALELVLAA